MIIFSHSVSVLMAVYNRDDPMHFADALDSLLPFVDLLESVVLVADGPLSEDLELVILKRLLILKINTVRLPLSVGLGEALNAGLHHTSSDYVLRMDADDLCRPERLEILLNVLAKEPSLDVVGSFISEFESVPLVSRGERRVPLLHDDILRLMRTRCVMNHVSCLLRRKTVIDAGGYSGGNGFAEDWWLWVRLLSRGARFRNVNSVLVDVRVGNGFVGRRRGISMLRQDLRLIYMMYNIGFIRWYLVINLFMIKLIQRLSPSFVLRFFYLFLRHSPSSFNSVTKIT